MDGLTAKTLNQRESMIAYRESVAQLTKTLKENGAAHGFNTAKGRENEQALDAVAAKAQAAAQGMKADGKSAREVSAYLEGARRTLIAAAEKMGYSSTKARELASQVRDEGRELESAALEHGLAVMPRLMFRKELDPALVQALDAASGGELVGPVGTAKGFALLQARERRTPELDGLTRTRIEHELFANWVDAHMKQATIDLGTLIGS